MIAQGRFRSAEQEIAGAVAIELQPNDQRLTRERVEVHSASHVNQKRLKVEVFDMRLAWKPALAPATEFPDHAEQLHPRWRERILRSSRAFGSSNRLGVNQCPQPFGKHGA
jgi:hypothetical protein